MSKGLEALKVLVMSSTTIFNTKEQIDESINAIKKELKALEIIRNKRVNVRTFLQCENVEQYNRASFSDDLSQEQYDLLKEVLLAELIIKGEEELL